jgi:two-component system KDP operon response regulator KdpE
MKVDGFLTRPFEPDDLVHRLSAIQSRNGHDEKRWVYQRNGLTVDFRSCEVFVDGQSVQLTGTEYRLLTYLIERRGWVVSHDQILNHVWGSDYLGEKDQVKLYIWYLRRKIEADPKQPKNIVTKRGLGYTFVA